MAVRWQARAAVGIALALPSGCSFLESFDGFSATHGLDGGPLDGARDVDAAAVCAPDASFSSDAKNCGACGHDCLGGDCTGGHCQPFTLLEGVGAWAGIAVSQGKLVWTTTTGPIMQAEVDGGGAAAIVFDQPFASALAFAAVTDGPVTMYWGMANEIRSAGFPVTDPHAWQIAVGALAQPVRGVAFEPSTSTLFWSDETDIHSARPPKLAAAVFLPNEAAYAIRTSTDVADRFLYFTTNGANTVKKVPLAGGPSQPLTAADETHQNTYDVAADERGIYWVDRNALAGGDTHGSVNMLPLGAAGSTPSTALATDQDSPSGIAIDPTAYYWTLAGDSSGHHAGDIVKLAR